MAPHSAAPALVSTRGADMLDQTLVQLLYTCSEDLEERTHLLVAADYAAESGHGSVERCLRKLAEHRGHRPIIFTGSRCYGTPKPDSDFDWVVFMGPQLSKELAFWADSDSKAKKRRGRLRPNYEYSEHEGRLDRALRFGPINLIVVSHPDQYRVWRDGTDKLKAESGVTRDRAIEVFQAEWRAVEEEYERLWNQTFADQV